MKEFEVQNQKIALNFDFKDEFIKGRTEYLILPGSPCFSFLVSKKIEIHSLALISETQSVKNGSRDGNLASEAPPDSLKDDVVDVLAQNEDVDMMQPSNEGDKELEVLMVVENGLKTDQIVYKRTDKELKFENAKDPFRLVVEYSFYQNYFPESQLPEKSPQIQLSSSQGICQWLPFILREEKNTFELFINIPDSYEFEDGRVEKMVCVSTGDFIGRYDRGSMADEYTPDQTSQSRITVFYLPRFKNEINFSCFYLPQALQFAEQWIGASYPFSTLNIVFAETSHAPFVSGASVIIASTSLLLQPNVIDDVFQIRFSLCFSIGHQWFGHYISPASWDDLWIIIGFSRALAYQFMKKIHGNNEVRFRIKKDTERLCLIDTKQLPICPVNVPRAHQDVLVGNYFSPFDDPSSIRGELMNLKSSLVLIMMERRFGKGLLSKLASKIMMIQMSGELTAGISTIELLKMARKISGKLEIKEFADQWIFGSGCPIFTTNYNFNRKKMVIELKIQQRSSNEGMIGGTPKFTGPFTVRVQEPGGTFDTEIRIEEYSKQYDIIYHTKYKRIRRGATKKSKKNANGEEEEEEEEVEEDADKDAEEGETGLELIAEPDRITFEWIRLDPDNVWLSHLTFEQEDFMWNSVIRQDKDVNAQYEFDTKEVEYMGLTNLMKYFMEHYVMEEQGNIVPHRNNFEDLQDYFIRNSVISALSLYRDDRGWAPTSVRKLLVDLLRFNDNTNNPFSDSVALANILDCIGNSFLQRPKNSSDLAWCLSERIKYKETREVRTEDVEEFEFPSEAEQWSRNNCDTVKLYFSPEDHNLLDLVLSEISRYLVKDMFDSSFQNAITVTCLEVLTKWQVAGLVPVNIAVFLSYSRFGNYLTVRKMAIEGLIVVTALKDEEICRYLANICLYDHDEYVRYNTVKALVYFVALACHQVENSSHQTSRKTTLKKQMETMVEVWSEYDSNLLPNHIEKYITKLKNINNTFFPVKPKLKFKMPSLQTVKEIIKVSGEPKGEADSDTMEVEKPPATIRKKAPAKPKEPKDKEVEKKPVVPPTPVKVRPPHLEKCFKQWKRIDSHKSALWFKNPVFEVLKQVDVVALNIPQYLEMIKTPMDLSTIRKKIDDEVYQTEEEFSEDMKLVFTNAMAFNPPGTSVHIDAQVMLAKFEKEFLGIKPAPIKLDEMTPIEICELIHSKLLLSEHSYIFREPVSRELYPEYFEVVKSPIDLRTIGEKIASKLYKTVQEMHDDVQLMFSNCFLFNKRNTVAFNYGTELKNVYQKLIKPHSKLINTRPPTKKRAVETPANALSQDASTPTPVPLTSSPAQFPKIKLSLPKLSEIQDSPKKQAEVVAIGEVSSKASESEPPKRTPILKLKLKKEVISETKPLASMPETPLQHKPIKLTLKMKPPTVDNDDKNEQ